MLQDARLFRTRTTPHGSRLSIEMDGRPVALVAHARGVDDTAIRNSVKRAAACPQRTPGSSSTLSISSGMSSGSRRRLLDAADDERRLLRLRLEERLEPRLASLEAALIEPEAGFSASTAIPGARGSDARGAAGDR